EQDRTAARAVLQRLGPSAEARRAKAPTLREQEYLHAVEVLYGDGAKAARDTAYSKAMERLVAAFPTDREAQVLYGVSLLGLSQGVRDVPTYLRAAAIAQRVFRDNPNHPGAAHLLIHCYDDAHRHLEPMRRNAEKGMRGRAVLAQMRAEYIVTSERWDCPCLRWDIDLTAVRARDAAVDLFTIGLSALRRGERAGAERALAD